jgi:glyoxylase-like metal-dependent hydrolase (beta-lactamase superfamily II)
MLTPRAFPFNPFQENTYLLYNESGACAIVDPGCYHAHEEETLAEFIRAHKLKPEWLLLTHAHLDHVFGLAWAAKTYGLVPLLHRNEEQVLQRAPVAGQMYGVPTNGYSGSLQWLAEGQTIRMGEDELQVLFAPGHSPGHVCFYCPQQGFVVGGDVLFQRSVGRTDLPGGNHAVLMESIRTQLYTLPEATVVYPGHGPATTIGEEKRENPFVRG